MTTKIIQLEFDLYHQFNMKYKLVSVGKVNPPHPESKQALYMEPDHFALGVTYRWEKLPRAGFISDTNQSNHRVTFEGTDKIEVKRLATAFRQLLLDNQDRPIDLYLLEMFKRQVLGQLNVTFND